MYQVERNGRMILEADACGIGFLASRKGVAQRRVVEQAIELTKNFDHRGAPGHGSGFQIDIPWGLLLDRFKDHTKLVAQHDVALGMFFLPFDSKVRQKCIEEVEHISALAGVRVLDWKDVPVNPAALPKGSSALRTLPRVRQALFKRPDNMSEEGWFACRYLLRLALDEAITAFAGDEFSICSLSNRTVVYKGLCDLSRIADFYTDLQSPDFKSRYVLFHSRYCTNTTTAWRRAQPFWSIAHNGEISTINGNVAWMQAIGEDLVRNLVGRFPSLAAISELVNSIVCPRGSDTANLDDMMIALLAGGMSFEQAMLGLLPSAESVLAKDDPLRDFYRATRVYLGACDGPAAIVGCDGDVAVAHLDRNGLRPLWAQVSKDYVLAVSELTGTIDIGPIEEQTVLGPGETILINLNNGRVSQDEKVRTDVAREPFPSPMSRMVPGDTTHHDYDFSDSDLLAVQLAFGVTKEDVDVVMQPMSATGKPPLGAMGDDTPLAAMLDTLPRRIEDHFKLRFAQETSPPVDPIRDAWVFDTTVNLGDRSGLWRQAEGQLYSFESPILDSGQLDWLKAQPGVAVFSLLVPIDSDFEAAFENALQRAEHLVQECAVIVLSDLAPSKDLIALPSIRFVSCLHSRLVESGFRHRVGIAVEAGVWDVHHCALHVTLGADAICPWLGLASVQDAEKYIKAIRSGTVEAMSMMGVTPAAAYTGARLVEAIGLSFDFLAKDFPGVPGHISGIDKETLNSEWREFHQAAFAETPSLTDVGEFRHTRDGRKHANNAEIVRSLQSASGYTKKIHEHKPGTYEAYQSYSSLVSGRSPLNLLDLIQVKTGDSVSIEEVESIESILWRFMAPGMSEGALSEPAHRAVARAFNILYRFARTKGGFPGVGPIANSGEGGFEKSRIRRPDGNRSVQYAGGRFTITPMTAACADEAEVKFAQGAKPGKGGQLPGKKVSPLVAQRRGCEPGYELVSPPINHNLYSIEDVKLMVESWRHLNPNVNCALKFVATTGIEMVAVGGVNTGANRIHISDGCGGTGAAKRVDQKHAGLPAAAVLPTVQDMLVEEGVRHLVEVSVDGGVQNGEQALKLFLLGADKVGFGTSLLVAIGCSMLRKCHLSGIDPTDPNGKRRLGCTPGVATQDPEFIARFSGKAGHIARFLTFVAMEIRERMAKAGIRSLDAAIGNRNLLEAKPGISGKAAQLDLSSLLGAPGEHCEWRDYRAQSQHHRPSPRQQELEATKYVLQKGKSMEVDEHLTNADRCVGVGAAGMLARRHGDLGAPTGKLSFIHRGSAGHYYAAYSLPGMEFHLRGNIADSAFTAAYGGLLVVSAPHNRSGLSLVGSCFGYGARGGEVFIAGRAGNRFGICLRKNHEGGSPALVVEGVGANAFQYMTGGTALVLGSTGPNLGSGMSGGQVYLLDASPEMLNADYVGLSELSLKEAEIVRGMLENHVRHTESAIGRELLVNFDPNRFRAVRTNLVAEWLPEWSTSPVAEIL